MSASVAVVGRRPHSDARSGGRGRPTGGDANKSCHYVDAGVVISSGAMSSATWRCGVGLSANVIVLSGVVCQRVCAEAVW